MSDNNINLSAPLHAATKQGKLAAAREVFMDGDKETVQQIGDKTHQLENAIKDITATGGASTANAVSYSNETSGMTAVTAQGAIDELAAKNKAQDSSISTKAEKTDVQSSVSELKTKNTLQDAEIAKKANSADVTSKMQTEQARVNNELAKKFDKESILQESGEAEDKVMSQKAVSDKLSYLTDNVYKLNAILPIIGNRVDISELGTGKTYDYVIISKAYYEKGTKIAVNIENINGAGVYIREIKENGEFGGPVIISSVSFEYTITKSQVYIILFYKTTDNKSDIKHLYKLSAIVKVITNDVVINSKNIEDLDEKFTDKLNIASTNEGLVDIGLTADDSQELDYLLNNEGILCRRFQGSYIPVRINQDKDAQNGIILDRQKYSTSAAGHTSDFNVIAIKKYLGESKIYVSVGDISYPESQSDRPFILVRFLANNGDRLSQISVYANSNEEVNVPKDTYLIQIIAYLSITASVRDGIYIFNKIFITTDYLNSHLNEKILKHSDNIQALSDDIQTFPNIGKTFFDDDTITYVGIGGNFDRAFYTEMPASTKLGKFYIKLGNVEVPNGGKQGEVCVIYREENSSGNRITNNIYHAGDDVVITQGVNAAKIIIIVFVSTDSISIKGGTYTIHNLTIGYGGIHDILGLKDETDPTVIKDWEDATMATYGDSITAICNGDFSSPFNISDTQNWANRVANYYGMSKQLGRGIGSQGFMWRDNGGAICFINADTGTLIDRMQNYNYATWMALEEKDFYDSVRHIDLSSKVSKEQIDNGVIIPIRGCFCSWLRIKTMFPESIKDNVDLIFVMGGTNDSHDETKATWVPNDETDPEWKSSEYYSAYGGDYNISTIKGGIASTIMKMQAWMPNAIIVLGTNLNGHGADKTLGVDEADKAKDMIEVAQLLGIPCIDVFGTTGINGLNSTRFITDGIHPYSVIGSKYVARSIIGGLKSVISTDYV